MPDVLCVSYCRKNCKRNIQALHGLPDLQCWCPVHGLMLTILWSTHTFNALVQARWVSLHLFQMRPSPEGNLYFLLPITGLKSEMKLTLGDGNFYPLSKPKTQLWEQDFEVQRYFAGSLFVALSWAILEGPYEQPFLLVQVSFPLYQILYAHDCHKETSGRPLPRKQKVLLCLVFAFFKASLLAVTVRVRAKIQPSGSRTATKIGVCAVYVVSFAFCFSFSLSQIFPVFLSHCPLLPLPSVVFSPFSFLSLPSACITFPQCQFGSYEKTKLVVQD